MKYLIACLGNIGAEYESTRHNVGFDIADKLAGGRAAFHTDRYGDVAQLRMKGRLVTVLKPSTYMNLSGNAVRYWLQKEGVAQENLLVVADDLSLPLGKIRMRARGSDGGHNGLKHIIQVLGGANFARLRFGIGDDFPRGAQIDFVLGRWSDEERKAVDERLETCAKAIEAFVMVGVERAMNTFNTKE